MGRVHACRNPCRLVRKPSGRAPKRYAGRQPQRRVIRVLTEGVATEPHYLTLLARNIDSSRCSTTRTLLAAPLTLVQAARRQRFSVAVRRQAWPITRSRLTSRLTTRTPTVRQWNMGSRPDVVRIRPAVGTDSEQVEDLVRSAYEIYLDRMTAAPAPLLADYADLIEQGVVTIAEAPSLKAQGDVVGVLVMWPADDHIHIDNLATSPTLRGSGVGSKLLAHADRAARATGLGQLRLYTNAAMTENLEYYPRQGFAETDRRTEGGYDRVYFSRPVPGSATSLSVRSAVEADLPSIAALHAASWRTAYVSILPDHFLARADDMAQQEWQTFPTGAHVLVADIDGTVAGFAAAYEPADAPGQVLLHNLHVDPERRSSGIGANLLDTVLAHASANDAEMHLWVLSDNLRGRYFYRRNGGTEGEQRVAEFEHNVSAAERSVHWSVAL